MGEIDAATSVELAAAIAALGPDVRLDLAGCTFIDSSGISLLVDLWYAARSNQARLTLVAPSPPVQRLLAMCGLTESFDIEATSVAAR